MKPLATTNWELELRSIDQYGDFAYVTLILLALFSVIAWLYMLERQRQTMRVWQACLLAALRAGALAVAATMLLEPSLSLTRTQEITRPWLLLVDTSQSMQIEDVPRDDMGTAKAPSPPEVPGPVLTDKPNHLGSRWMALRDELGPLRQRLQELPVQVVSFDEQVRPWESLDSLRTAEPAGGHSAIGGALQAVTSHHDGASLAGIILMSDGRQTAGPSPQAIAQSLGRAGVPVHTLALGNPQTPTQVLVDTLDVNANVFRNDPVTIRGVLVSQGLANTTGRMVLEACAVETPLPGLRDSPPTVTDGIGDHAWELVQEREVTFAGDNIRQELFMTWPAGELGEWLLRLRAIPDSNEAGEHHTTRGVRVIDHSIRVLLIAGYPAPEVQFLRNTLMRDTTLEFSCWLQSASDDYQQLGTLPLQHLPLHYDELQQYDCLLLFDPNLDRLPANWAEHLKRFVGQDGGGCAYVAGEWNTSALFSSILQSETPRRSPWYPLLPVVVERDALASRVEMQLSSRALWNLQLTREGQSHPLFRFADNELANRRLLNSLPGMYWHFPVSRAKSGATVLAEHGDPRMQNEHGPHVLLALQRYGPGKTAFVAFDSTYRWRYVHDSFFDGFWTRLVDQLGRDKALGGQTPYEVTADRSRYEPGDRIRLVLRPRAAGAVDSIPPSAVPPVGFVEVNGQRSYELEWALRPAEPQSPDRAMAWTAEAIARQPGHYLVRARPSHSASDPSDEDVAAAVPECTLELDVTHTPTEFADRTSDPRVLQEIARASGGVAFTWPNRSELAAILQPQSTQRYHEEHQPLWNHPLLFGVIPLALTAEWYLRKRWRMT